MSCFFKAMANTTIKIGIIFWSSSLAVERTGLLEKGEERKEKDQKIRKTPCMLDKADGTVVIFC